MEWTFKSFAVMFICGGTIREGGEGTQGTKNGHKALGYGRPTLAFLCNYQARNHVSHDASVA
jgi:hypothetical protein